MTWAYAWALLTLPILGLAARFPLERPHLARALLLHAVFGVGAVLINLELFAALAPFVGAPSSTGTWSATYSRLLVTTFLPDLSVYFVLVGTAQILRLVLASHERERRHLRLETQLSEARLLALKAQLQPHFLFNTLNSISVLILDDPKAANRMLLLLCNLLRKVLDSSDSHEVTLREELDFATTYLAIEQIRFADRLSYRIDATPEVLEARVPSLILQPLVENAIRHGIASRASPGNIVISAKRHAGKLHLTVADNGPGMGEQVAYGIGLSNTRSRLEQLFGGDHEFQVGDNASGGTMVSLMIPLREVAST